MGLAGDVKRKKLNGKVVLFGQVGVELGGFCQTVPQAVKSESSSSRIVSFSHDSAGCFGPWTLCGINW